MPLYRFECDCEAAAEIMGSMDNPPTERQCHVCDEPMYRVFGNNVFSFKPYTENNLGDRGVIFETTKQRDAVLAKKHLTYDSTKYLRRKIAPAAIDSITDGDIKRAAEEGNKDDSSVALPTFD